VVAINAEQNFFFEVFLQELSSISHVLLEEEKYVSAYFASIQSRNYMEEDI
jgi:hypothetical protein